MRYSEKKGIKNYISVSDIVFAAAAAGASILVFLFLTFSPGGNTAVVTKGGTVAAELPLEKDAEITVTGEYENIIAVKNGEVFVRSSTCGNQICVHTGKISLSGQAVVCAPNGVVITVRGEGEFDAVSQ